MEPSAGGWQAAVDRASALTSPMPYSVGYGQAYEAWVKNWSADADVANMNFVAHRDRLYDAPFVLGTTGRDANVVQQEAIMRKSLIFQWMGEIQVILGASRDVRQHKQRNLFVYTVLASQYEEDNTKEMREYIVAQQRQIQPQQQTTTAPANVPFDPAVLEQGKLSHATLREIQFNRKVEYTASMHSYIRWFPYLYHYRVLHDRTLPGDEYAVYASRISTTPSEIPSEWDEDTKNKFHAMQDAFGERVIRTNVDAFVQQLQEAKNVTGARLYVISALASKLIDKESKEYRSAVDTILRYATRFKAAGNASSSAHVEQNLRKLQTMFGDKDLAYTVDMYAYVQRFTKQATLTKDQRFTKRAQGSVTTTVARKAAYVAGGARQWATGGWHGDENHKTDDIPLAANKAAGKAQEAATKGVAGVLKIGDNLVDRVRGIRDNDVYRTLRENTRVLLAALQTHLGWSDDVLNGIRLQYLKRFDEEFKTSRTPGASPEAGNSGAAKPASGVGRLLGRGRN